MMSQEYHATLQRSKYLVITRYGAHQAAREAYLRHKGEAGTAEALMALRDSTFCERQYRTGQYRFWVVDTFVYLYQA